MADQEIRTPRHRGIAVFSFVFGASTFLGAVVLAVVVSRDLASSLNLLLVGLLLGGLTALPGWLLLWRPVLVIGQDGCTVVGPLSTQMVPWKDVRRADSSSRMLAIDLVSGERVTVWAVQARADEVIEESVVARAAHEIDERAR